MPYAQIDIRLIPVKQYTTPTTGSTVTVNTNGFVTLKLNPAGTLVSLTLALPGSPSDGDRINISSTQAITTLTMSGGTIIGALTTMAIGTFATYEYNSDSTEWWRVA